MNTQAAANANPAVTGVLGRASSLIAWQGGGSHTAVMPASAMASALSVTIASHAGLRLWSLMVWHSQLKACMCSEGQLQGWRRWFEWGYRRVTPKAAGSLRSRVLNVWVKVTVRFRAGLTLRCRSELQHCQS